MRNYDLKKSERIEHVFGSPPDAFPHGKVEINATNWLFDGANEDVISAKAIGVYLQSFNRHPIRYYVFNVVLGKRNGGSVQRHEADVRQLTEEQKSKVIDLVHRA